MKQPKSRDRIKHSGPILVVYPHLPHYRAGVFRELEAQSPWAIEFVAGPSSRDGSIATISPDQLDRVHLITNRWLGGALWQSGLLNLVRRRRPVAVIFLGDAHYVSSWAAAALLRARRVPVFFWTIGWHKPETGVKRQVRLLFYRLADKLLLYGHIGLELGHSYGYPRERMAVIGNSHDVNSISPTDEIAATDLVAQLPRGEIVGAVIRLNAHKRLDLLIDAVAQLRRSGRDVSVLLVGAGPELENLRVHAQQMRVPLSTPGAIYSSETIDRIYDSLKVTVVPVAVGLTAIQSLTHGTPVVTCDDPYLQMPEYEAIVPGRTGSLYRSDSVSSLADHIAQWLDTVAERPDDVSAECQNEITARWTSEAHAERILATLRADLAAEHEYGGRDDDHS